MKKYMANFRVEDLLVGQIYQSPNSSWKYGKIIFAEKREDISYENATPYLVTYIPMYSGKMREHATILVPNNNQKVG